MRKDIRLFALAAGALVIFASLASFAEARDQARPLTVRPRSFTDAGKVPAYGEKMRYATSQTLLNQTPDRAYMRSRFGNETLPARFELPGVFR